MYLKTTVQALQIKPKDCFSNIYRSRLLNKHNMNISYLCIRNELLSKQVEKALQEKNLISEHKVFIAEMKNQIIECTNFTNNTLRTIFKEHNEIIESCQRQILLSSNILDRYNKENIKPEIHQIKIVTLFRTLLSIVISAMSKTKVYLNKVFH